MFSIQEYKQQIYNIIGAAMEVHHELGLGLLEPIYQEALQVELNDMNIPNEREQEIPIRYKNHLLEKKYKVDFLVGDIVIELKSVEHLTSDHRAQLCNYLRLTKKPIGLLINFGEKSLVGERWVYDPKTNICDLVNKDMQVVYSK